MNLWTRYTESPLYKKRFLILFITLLIPYLLHPLYDAEWFGVKLLDFSFSLLFVVGILAVSSKKHFAFVALSLLGLAQTLAWMSHSFSSTALTLTAIGLNCLYLTYITVLLLKHILSIKTVSTETIFASLCVYLLMGFIWAFIYSLLDDLVPHSFQINPLLFTSFPSNNHIYSKLYYFIYFSFTTLSTLSFGDIFPSSPWSRVFVSLEGITGPIYLVCLVSRLVGLHISQSTRLKS